MSDDWCTVVTKHFEKCQKCARTLIMDGPANRFEAGYDENGKELVMDGLKAWLMSPRKRKRERLAEFIVVLEKFVMDPSEMTSRELKRFQGDLWEIKAGTLRIIFSGGACDGGDPNRTVILNKRVGQMSIEDRCCRGLIAFGKSNDRAGRKKTDLAIAVAREDKKR